MSGFLGGGWSSSILWACCCYEQIFIVRKEPKIVTFIVVNTWARFDLYDFDELVADCQKSFVLLRSSQKTACFGDFLRRIIGRAHFDLLIPKLKFNLWRGKWTRRREETGCLARGLFDFDFFFCIYFQCLFFILCSILVVVYIVLCELQCSICFVIIYGSI